MPVKTAKAEVDLTQNDEGLWLTVKDASRTATILLPTETHGPLVRDTIRAWADHCFLLQPSKRETAMKRLLAFVTGAIALVIVAAAAGSAITYAVMHGAETLTLLGNAALTGIGMAVGGCLGSALVLRFKVARHYVKGFLKEINEKHIP